MTWQVYALLSAVAAGATAVLAKIGVEGVPSNLATAIRTVVILVFVSAIVAARGEYRALAAISPRALLFLVLSGCATGLSGWHTFAPCRSARPCEWRPSTS